MLCLLKMVMNLSKLSWLVLLGLSLAVSGCLFPKGYEVDSFCHTLGETRSKKLVIEALPRELLTDTRITPQKFRESFLNSGLLLTKEVSLNEQDWEKLLRSCQKSKLMVETELYMGYAHFIDTRARVRFLGSSGEVWHELYLDQDAYRMYLDGDEYFGKGKFSRMLVELVWGDDD